METPKGLSVHAVDTSESPPTYSEANDISTSGAGAVSPFYSHETKTSTGDMGQLIEDETEENTTQTLPMEDSINEDIDIERQQLPKPENKAKTWDGLQSAKGHPIILAVTRITAIASLPIMEVMLDSPVCNDSSAIFSLVCWFAWSLYTMSTAQQYFGLNSKWLTLVWFTMHMFLMPAMSRVFVDDRSSTCGTQQGTQPEIGSRRLGTEAGFDYGAGLDRAKFVENH